MRWGGAFVACVFCLNIINDFFSLFTDGWCVCRGARNGSAPGLIFSGRGLISLKFDSRKKQCCFYSRANPFLGVRHGVEGGAVRNSKWFLAVAATIGSFFYVSLSSYWPHRLGTRVFSRGRKHRTYQQNQTRNNCQAHSLMRTRREREQGRKREREKEKDHWHALM